MEQSKRNKYIRIGIRFLVMSGLAFGICWVFFTWNKVPANIHIKAYQKSEVTFGIPATGKISRTAPIMETVGGMEDDNTETVSVNLSDNVVFYGEDIHSYRMDVKLFGVIPFKTAEVSVIDDVRLMPVGKPIGIYVKTQGILVLEAGEFVGKDGQPHAPAMSLLQEGDYILACNGEAVDDKRVFMNMIGECDGNPIILTIDRDGQVFDMKLQPVCNEEGEYKLGIWIRDNAQGVGTMTYVDENNRFGALGHGINDVDTSALMKIEGGSLYKTDIIAIKKGESGDPGELTGLIAYSDRNRIGEISENRKVGIFGTVASDFVIGTTGEYLEPALKQEVVVGPAQILCCVDGSVEYYDVEITGLNQNSDNINRGIELRITDKKLLDKTGGIVQGMSGSPVIQNQRIVGAVTHVLVSNPEKGYAIFIENMLE